MGREEDKRIGERIFLESSFTVRHQGKACRVVDAGPTGLGITYIDSDEWPRDMVLEYSLDRESGQVRQVRCRTVWESTMNFYKTRVQEVVRRRGLAFVETESPDAEALLNHLRSVEEGERQDTPDRF